MRVLVLASTYPRWPGDTQPTFIRDFCRRLPDCEVHVLVPGAAGANAHEIVDGVRIHRFRYAPISSWQRLAYGGGMLANVRSNPLLFLLLPLFLTANFFSAWRLVRREHIDLVHAHWIIPQGVVAVLLRLICPKVRLVVTAHGGDAYAFNGRTGRAIKRFVLYRADLVTAVSTQLRDDLQHDLALASPPVVEPMGLDLTRFSVPASSRERRFCFVGRLVEKKGGADLLQAYARARAGWSDDDFPTLLLVGDGPLRGELEQQARQLGIAPQVTFSGWQEPAAVPTLMAGSLAVIVPSITARDGDREGLGLVAVEALATGTPVIAYDYGAIRDVVIPGEHGCLVPSRDIGELASALATAAAGAMPPISHPLRDAVRQRFDWQQVGKRYRALYDALLTR